MTDISDNKLSSPIMDGGDSESYYYHHHHHTHGSSEHHHHHHHHEEDESDFEKAHKRRMIRKYFVKGLYVFLCVVAVLIILYVIYIYHAD